MSNSWSIAVAQPDPTMEKGSLRVPRMPIAPLTGAAMLLTFKRHAEKCCSCYRKMNMRKTAMQLSSCFAERARSGLWGQNCYCGNNVNWGAASENVREFAVALDQLYSIIIYIYIYICIYIYIFLCYVFVYFFVVAWGHDIRDCPLQGSLHWAHGSVLG